MGDASDNIPGIHWIEEKTDQKLLTEFDSMENLLANTDKLKGKQKENIDNFAEQGLMSKKLATINIEVPIEFHEESLNLDPIEKQKITEVIYKLEFKNLLNRLVCEYIWSGYMKKNLFVDV